MRYYHQHKNLRLSLNSSFDSSVDSDNSSNDGTSSTSASTTSSSSSTDNNNNDNTGDSNGSNNSSPSNLSSAAKCDHALQSLHHSYFQSMCHIRHFLSTIFSTHVLFPHEVPKCSQLGLILMCYKEDDPSRFCRNLRVSPHTFDTLLSLIQDHPCFQSNGQWPVACQLAVALFRLGHFGNAASVDAVAQWAGCSVSAVVNATRRIIMAFLPLHNQAIRWPNAHEKQEASDWVESMSCCAWRPGFCMVDRMLIPLTSKPGHFGEQFFDHKSNYSLSLTVCAIFFMWITSTNILLASNITKPSYH